MYTRLRLPNNGQTQTMLEEIEYVDIIEPRRTSHDVFKFMAKYWNPQNTNNLAKPRSPQDLKDIVSKSVYIDTFLESECARGNKNKATLKQEVLAFLEEMGLDKKIRVIRWMGIVFLKISLMMKIQVFVNESAVFHLKSVLGNNPVLFLPTHRSYADFCLLTYLCFHYDIDFPAVAAGMDFHSMAVLGRTMRDTCAFYIRRTIADSPLYAATLREYVRALICHQRAPVEFFVEGTRSRSNKSLPPKYGMLSMALLPLFTREVDDITIVPINISYDRLMEQNLFAYEHLGVPKPKESTSALIKALRMLNDNFGNIYINPGSPLSVKKYLKDIPLLTKEILNPVDLQKLTPEQFISVQDVANHVVSLQQKNTVVTISNLLALVLMQNIIKGESVYLETLVKEVEWMIDVLRGLGASVFESNVINSLERILIVHNKIVQFGKDKTLHLLCSPNIKVTVDMENNMKGHILEQATMITAVPVIELQLYVNPVMYYLLPPALVCRLAAATKMNKECLARNYREIRNVLKYEYFFSEKDDDTFEESLSYCIRNDVIAVSEDFYIPGGNEKLNYLFSWSMWPSLTLLRLCIIVANQQLKFNHQSMLKLVQAQVEQHKPQCHPYCLSLEMIGNCLQGLVQVGALERQKANDGFAYKTVPATLKYYEELITVVLPQFDVNFNNNPIILNEVAIPCRL